MHSLTPYSEPVIGGIVLAQEHRKPLVRELAKGHDIEKWPVATEASAQGIQSSHEQSEAFTKT